MDSAIKNYYESFYRSLMHKGITGKIFSISNKMIEKPFKETDCYPIILELGATTDNHLTFVKCTYKEYHLTDLNQVKLLDSEAGKKVIVRKLDASNFTDEPSNFYDRIIATCLILHLDNIEKVLNEWKRATKQNGYISIYVHCEPGILLRFMRSVITVPKSFIKSRNNHFDLVYLEHKTHFLHVKHTIEKVFTNDEVHQVYFPFRFLTWNFNFWKIYTIKVLNK
jgi:SAM-dependent methyltransferase